MAMARKSQCCSGRGKPYLVATIGAVKGGIRTVDSWGVAPETPEGIQAWPCRSCHPLCGEEGGRGVCRGSSHAWSCGPGPHSPPRSCKASRTSCRRTTSTLGLVLAQIVQSHQTSTDFLCVGTERRRYLQLCVQARIVRACWKLPRICHSSKATPHPVYMRQFNACWREERGVFIHVSHA